MGQELPTHVISAMNCKCNLEYSNENPKHTWWLWRWQLHSGMLEPMKDYIAKFSFKSSVLSRPEAHQTTTFIEANDVSDAPVTIPPP